MAIPETYVLRFVGESMEEEGVYDGDYIIIERRTVPEPGEIVVALLVTDAGEAEATLKRWYPEDGAYVRLQPLNRKLTSLHVPADACRVQGVAVGVMRKFKTQPLPNFDSALAALDRIGEGGEP